MLKIFFRKFRPTKHQAVTMNFRAEVPVRRCFLADVTEIFRASPQQHVFASLWMTL